LLEGSRDGGKGSWVTCAACPNRTPKKSGRPGRPRARAGLSRLNAEKGRELVGGTIVSPGLKVFPKELDQPPAQPWPFFFLATFLAAFFFFFAIVMAPCHEHPHCYTTIPPGALLEGTVDVSLRVEASQTPLLTRCVATLHRAANGVVKDDSENCQEMFRIFFEKISQNCRCTPPADAVRTLTRGAWPLRDRVRSHGSLPTP